MPHLPEHLAIQLRDALNEVTVIYSRAQLLRRRWARSVHPLGTAGLDDLLAIEASCRELSESLRSIHAHSATTQDHIEEVEDRLAELARLLESPEPDLATMRRLLAERT